MNCRSWQQGLHDFRFDLDINNVKPNCQANELQRRGRTNVVSDIAALPSPDKSTELALCHPQQRVWPHALRLERELSRPSSSGVTLRVLRMAYAVQGVTPAASASSNGCRCCASLHRTSRVPSLVCSSSKRAGREVTAKLACSRRHLLSHAVTLGLWLSR